MTKIVENIIEKAIEEGYANKSKYQARYNKDSGTLELDHWGDIVTGKQIGRAHV